MTPKMKARWIKALRSGRYLQCRHFAGQIIDGKEHNCCLGVYARIAHCKTVDTVRMFVPRINNECHTPLPDYIMPKDIQRIYAHMNDEGYTFAEIADAIEKDTRI